MSSQRSSPNNFMTPTDEFSSGTGSTDELPNDLETARAIIENLTRQLKIHDDVTSSLILLQKRIQHTHQRTQDAMQMLEDRLDNVEATWTKELEEQHKRWLDRYNRLIKEAESTRTLNKETSEAPAASDGAVAKVSKNQLESFNRRINKVDNGLIELEKVATSTKNFDEKLRLDKQRIRDIDSRLKALTKKEQTLNAELAKQMNVHFRKPFSQIAEEQSVEHLYGVCEVTDGYQKTIDNLNKALQKLEQIRKVPAKKSIENTIKNMPSADEIDEITIIMRRFLAKLRVQLATARFSGSPSSAAIHTGRSVSPTTSQSLNSSITSDYGTTPLNTSQSAGTGPSSSTAQSQFMALKSKIPSEDIVTAKEKTNEISSDKKK